jgi:hypothetical protein
MRIVYFQREEHISDGPISWNERREGFYIPDKKAILLREPGSVVREASDFSVSKDPRMIGELDDLLKGKEFKDWTRYDSHKVFDYSEHEIDQMISYARGISNLKEILASYMEKVQKCIK